MRFADIIGHRDTIQSLRHMADSGRIPHALMLSGPQGIGKTRLARAFAQYVHCTDRRDGDSCGRCPSCVQHQSLNNPDMHYVYPVVRSTSPKRAVSTDCIDEWRQMLDTDPYMSPATWLDIIEAGNSQPAIYVDEAEVMNSAASLSAFKEDYKIFLIWLPERMRAETANKLLKLIEEPFADTLFILVSNDSGSVLPTIFSRTQRLNMMPLSTGEVTEALTGLGLDRHDAGQAALLAEGSVTRALEAGASAAESLEFANLFKALMRAAYARQMGMLLSLTEKSATFGREKLRRFLAYCSRMVRENFIANLQRPELLMMNHDEREFSVRFAPFINAGNVEGLAEEFSRAYNDIGGNANAKIVMFDLGLYLCALIRTGHK